MGDSSSNFIKIGRTVPVGDDREVPWDEKGQTKRNSIQNSEVITSIQFQYAGENGTSILSDRHGENCGSKYAVVKLNYPDEYITQISGHQNNLGLSSITFGRNHGEYGPFGKPYSTKYDKFCYEVGDGQFGGFYGSTFGRSLFLFGVSSIGVYLKPNMNSNYTPV